MNLSYKKTLFLYFFLLFSVFTLIIIVIQQRTEKQTNRENIENTLEDYVNITQKYIQNNNLNLNSFEELYHFDMFLLDNVRISLIDKNGKVLYDKDINNFPEWDNHLTRPEIQNAISQSYGIHIRKSATTNQEYIYYAKRFDDYFIRVALPYSSETKNLLSANRYFIYITILLFVIVLIIMNFVSGRFQKSIFQLKNFTTQIKNNKADTTDIVFPEDELGEIGEEIIDIFNQKEESNRQAIIEREKLILHFQYSEKGICIFTPDFKTIYANSHFNYYVNLVLEYDSKDKENSIFDELVFQPVVDFMQDKSRQKNQFEYKVERSGKFFAIQVLIFEDKSFEITIKDTTEVEQNALLKQQMTSNIAHELKTPVTSIHAYLESLLEGKFPEEMRKQFIERAFAQSERLTELIDDVSLLSKIEEASVMFQLEEINMRKLVDDIFFDMSDKLIKNNIKTTVSINENVNLQGNTSLIYSVIRNLIDNSIKYGGNGIEINISNYSEDEQYLYFSYYDTGKGVSEEHLRRIFERFYRVDSGRTRDAGGSGLGLSIVKNAVIFHKGKIEAKKHINGGLQFLFTFKKHK